MSVTPDALLQQLVAELCARVVFGTVQRLLCEASVCPHCHRKCRAFRTPLLCP